MVLFLEYPAQEAICGRPTGLAFDTIGDNLIITDAYYGIWIYNLKNQDKKQLVDPKKVIGGVVPRPAKLFNSVTVAKNGDFYWTDSTSDFDIQDAANAFFVNPSGRLVHYNRETMTNTVLIDKIFFAFGVALSPDESFVLVAETAASRIQKYFLKGEKKGTTEIFIEGLPGIPDKIRADKDGMWIAFVSSADSENPQPAHYFAPVPYIRKFIVRIVCLIEKVIWFFDLYKSVDVQALRWLAPTRNTIIRLDWNGTVVSAMHGFDGTAHTISDVLEFEDHLYLGSPFNDFIGRVKFTNKEKYSNNNMAI